MSIQTLSRRVRGLVVAGCVALVAGAAPVFAEPVDFHRVPRDAQWVMHLDFESLFAGELGPWLRERLDTEPRLAGLRRTVRNAGGFDPTRDLIDLTLYGPADADAAAAGEPAAGPRRPGTSPGMNAVVVATVGVQAEGLPTNVRSHPGFEQLRHGPHTVYSWPQRRPRRAARADTEGVVPPEGPRQFLSVYGELDDRRLIVTAPTEASMKTALDVLDGTAPAAAGLDRFARPEVGARYYLAAQDLAGLAAAVPQVAMFQQVRTVVVQSGEHAGEMYVRLRLQAPNTGMAVTMRDAMIGLRLIVQARAAAEAPSDKLPGLIERIDITQHDDTVQLHLRIPTSQVGEVLREQWDKPRT